MDWTGRTHPKEPGKDRNRRSVFVRQREKVNPHNYRRVPVDTNLFGIKPDIIILTHNHMDHTDEETLRHYITQDSRVTVLASGEAWKTVRKFGGAENNYVLFNCGTAGQMEASDSAPSTRSIPIAVQLA